MVRRGGFKVLIITILFLAFLRVSVSEAGTLTVIDKLGRKITVETPVKRAVLIITYELIPALDIWNQVIAVSRWAETSCDLYRAFISLHPEYKKISVGAGVNLNVETILKLHPDLIITWTYHIKTVRFLQEQGLKVFTVYPDSLKELYQLILLHGKLFGKEKRAKFVIKEMQKVFSFIQKRLKGIKKKKKVLYIGSKPTVVLGKIGVTADLIKIAGGINVAEKINRRYITVSSEQILKWNPDVIFIWGSASYNPEFVFKKWSYLKAVKRKQVFKLPHWSTWSPRSALLALFMAKKLYPSIFEDVNFEKFADNFYRKIFKISYNYVKKFEKF